MVKRYTKEQIDYLRSISKGRYNDEITNLFNKKFGLNKTKKQISSCKKNHGITSGKLPKRRSTTRLFTEEQEGFIRENAEGRYNEELAQLVNREFDLNVTSQQIKTWKTHHGVTSGLTGHFEEGQTSWNKGKKGWSPKGSEKGWFKKGQKPKNYRPVGSKRIDSKDGYTLIKVQDEGTWPERWRHKHVVVWEKHYGEKLPDGHVIVFADSDRQNFDIDNLLLVSRDELVRMNQQGLIFNDPELTKTGLQLARLNIKITDINIYGNDREEFQKYVKKAAQNGIQELTFIARLRRGWGLKDAIYRPLHHTASRERVTT